MSLTVQLLSEMRFWSVEMKHQWHIYRLLGCCLFQGIYYFWVWSVTILHKTCLVVRLGETEKPSWQFLALNANGLRTNVSLNGSAPWQNRVLISGDETLMIYFCLFYLFWELVAILRQACLVVHFGKAAELNWQYLVFIVDGLCNKPLCNVRAPQ